MLAAGTKSQREPEAEAEAEAEAEVRVFGDPHTGALRWKLPNGNLHRDGDRPAFVWRDCESYWRRGRLHRDGDKPAVQRYGNSLLQWYRDGVLHRDWDQPAFVCAKKGLATWWRRGVRQTPAQVAAARRWSPLRAAFFAAAAAAALAAIRSHTR
jgi:hypothetical protein